MNRVMDLKSVTDIHTVSTKSLILLRSLVMADAITSSNTTSDSLGTLNRTATFDPSPPTAFVSPWLNMGKFPSMVQCR